MRKLIAIVLACLFLLTACTSPRQVDGSFEVDASFPGSASLSENVDSEQKIGVESEDDNEDLSFLTNELDDEALLSYVEDNTYSSLVEELDSEDYFVENVEAIYYPKEYIEALASNTQPNKYFGFTSAELNEQFQGTKYVFTLGDDGETVVVPMETLSDEVYVKAIEDVMVGSGVILVCVTISIVSAPAAPAVHTIFTAAAATGKAFAIDSGVFSFVAAAIAKGYETESLEQAFRAGIQAGSKGFKWGAISGVTVGGAEKAVALKGATLNGLSLNEAARIQQESGWNLNIIKQLHSVEEYNVMKNAGLQAELLGGKLTLVRPDIDLYNVLDEYGQNNFARLSQGLNPIDATGKTFEWHHIGQNNDGTLALLTNSEHHAGALHGFKIVSEIDRRAFEIYKKEVLNRELLRWLLSIA